MSLVRMKKTYSDTLLSYFASLDEYRYELYGDLSDIDRLASFPARANKQLLLAQSKLLSEGKYVKPDSLVFLDKLKAEVKGHAGWIYFFKYKKRKDDATWKIASVGLLPMDSTKIEWQDEENVTEEEEDDDIYGYADKIKFTGFSNVKIREEEPVAPQLQKELKRMLYSKRKSARQFYDRSGAAESEDLMEVTIDEVPAEQNND